jgi:hypothetical protein
MQYKLLNGQDGKPCGVTVVGQNIFIPLYEGNTDYQAYLKWLDEGNVPEPAEQS